MARYFFKDLFNKPFVVPEPTFAWSDQYHDTLLERVSGINPPEGSGVHKPNILLLGAGATGKSSFINSIATVSEGVKVNLANTAGNVDHITTVYRKLEGNAGELQNYFFADVRGISGKDTGIHIGNIMKLINGHIKEEYEFKEDVAIDESDGYYIEKPKETDKFQCVVFVFDCNFNPSSTETLMQDISKLSSLLNQKGIPRIALLTQIDKTCPRVRSNIRHTFYSKKIKAKITKYSEVTGIPRPLFYPIKNYEDMPFPDKMTSILLLLALEACLRSAETYLRQKLGRRTSDKISQESDS